MSSRNLLDSRKINRHIETFVAALHLALPVKIHTGLPWLLPEPLWEAFRFRGTENGASVFRSRIFDLSNLSLHRTVADVPRAFSFIQTNNEHFKHPRPLYFFAVLRSRRSRALPFQTFTNMLISIVHVFYAALY